jgi:hypothetical protein
MNLKFLLISNPAFHRSGSGACTLKFFMAVGLGKTTYIVSATEMAIFGKLSWPNLTFLSPSPSLLCFPLT